MTQISVKLTISNRLEAQARQAGLLSGDFLRQAIQRELQRRSAATRLVDIGRQLRTAGVPPLTDKQLMAEIKAVRAKLPGGSMQVVPDSNVLISAMPVEWNAVEAIATRGAGRVGVFLVRRNHFRSPGRVGQVQTGEAAGKNRSQAYGFDWRPAPHRHTCAPCQNSTHLARLG